MPNRIAFLYEHPEWFRRLFAELDQRSVGYDAVDVSTLVIDPTEPPPAYDLVVNRMSPSAWTRGNGGAIIQTLRYLELLDAADVPILNGVEAFRTEISKARQLELFERLGVRYPAARAIGSPTAAPAAADGLRFPVVVKPNVGGSGAGIRSFDSTAELEAAVPTLDLGPDGTGLVQEHLPARGQSIVRIEIVGGEFLYAIKLLLEPGTFNLCPADYCRIDDVTSTSAGAGLADGVSGRGLPIEAYEPPAELIEEAHRIVAGAGMDVGGVEYLIDDRDGEAYFYDVNALSNFVADAEQLLGFDPHVQLVDLILDRARSLAAA